MLDIEHAAQKKQLLMNHRIQGNASDLMKMLIPKEVGSKEPNTWRKN